jgi:hypothetical protein
MATAGCRVIVVPWVGSANLYGISSYWTYGGRSPSKFLTSLMIASTSAMQAKQKGSVRLSGPQRKNSKTKNLRVDIPGQAQRVNFLRRRIEELKKLGTQKAIEQTVAAFNDEPSKRAEAFIMTEECTNTKLASVIASSMTKAATTPRQITPDAEATRLYSKWLKLLPSLVESFLSYLNFSTGRVVTPVGDLCSQCTQAGCQSKSAKITCLYFDRKCVNPNSIAIPEICLVDFRTIQVTGCLCQTLPQVLVANGLFPTAPSQPRMAATHLDAASLVPFNGMTTFESKSSTAWTAPSE